MEWTLSLSDNQMPKNLIMLQVYEKIMNRVFFLMSVVTIYHSNGKLSLIYFQRLREYQQNLLLFSLKILNLNRKKTDIQKRSEIIYQSYLFKSFLRHYCHLFWITRFLRSTYFEQNWIYLRILYSTLISRNKNI